MNIVQFVCFETSLSSDMFIKRWEEYHRSENSDIDVTLQQCGAGAMYKYLAQHRGDGDELRFVFSKGSRSSPHIRRESINTKQVGGYIVLQEERTSETRHDESKIFMFLNSPQLNINTYRHTGVDAQVNIYEAYYENCHYAYIHEFFVKNKHVSELVEQLKQFNPCAVGIYKECSVQHA